MIIKDLKCTITLNNNDVITTGDRVRAKGKNGKPYFTATLFHILTGYVLPTDNTLDNLKFQFSDAVVDGEPGSQFIELFLFELEELMPEQASGELVHLNKEEYNHA